MVCPVGVCVCACVCMCVIIALAMLFVHSWECRLFVLDSALFVSLTYAAGLARCVGGGVLLALVVRC